jgi:branched-chain amino acid transport system permease protein
VLGGILVVFVLLVPRGIVPTLGDLIDMAWRRLRKTPAHAPKVASPAAAPKAPVEAPHALAATETAP